MAMWSRTRTFLLLACVHGTSMPAAVDDLARTFTGHHVVLVQPQSKLHVKTLLNLKDSLELDFWNNVLVEGRAGLIQVPPESVDEIISVMESSGMQYHIKTDDLQSLINAEKHLMVPDEQVDSSQEPSSEELFDFSKYHSYNAVTRSLSAYAKAHSFVQLQTIGQTHDDNDIVAVKVARRQTLPVVLIDCGIHAREWVTISACMYIINELIGAEAPGSNISSIVNSYEWWVIPCLNPDGYEFSRKKNRLWRKNRSLQYSFNGTRCAGTDLNRNFDVSFCSGQDEADPCKETFCGKAPFSEPETHAFRELVAELRNRIAFYFSLHAFGDLWLIPYSFRVERPPDYDELMARATRAVQAIKTLSGETYKAGPVSSMLYLAPGTAIDWMYVKKSIRMSFTVEVSGEKVGFLLSQSEIARTSKQVWTGVLAVVQ